jgi:threonine dehydratase
MDDVRAAEQVVRPFLSPVPLIRSYALERALGLPPSRRVWLKDFGWTPSGSFKPLGALNWMACNLERIGTHAVVAHSSGNFAGGIAYAGMCFTRRVIVVMPQTAPRVKFERTRAFGAEIRTYDIARDHLTGERDRLTREIAESEGAIQASPYDDPHVIAGNGVGALEVVRDLQREGRGISHFFCPVSGRGLMAGQALAIADGFPASRLIGVEPEGADDFRQALAAGRRVRLDHPASICDGLLSYDVGEHNWPILRRLVHQAVALPDAATRAAMRWLHDQHGLRTEPTGAIAVAALFDRRVDLTGAGDVVVVISGRNVDDDAFGTWIGTPTERPVAAAG